MLTVGTQNEGKLNWLQRHLTEGLVVDAAWLERHGYSSALRSKYVRNGWLEQVTRGVYRRPPAHLPGPPQDEALRWQNAVISFQTLLGYRLTLGGRTALDLQGLAHYLPASGAREIHLYIHEDLPGWVTKLQLDGQLLFHNAAKLFGTVWQPDSNSLPSGLVRQQWGTSQWPIVMSTPERAILELLDEVPDRETFHQADMLMEGLVNLRPGVLRDLLADCRNVKVKRLFLWFAHRHNHAWLKRLDESGIDLGSGKRMIVRGGKLDKRFNITVPEDLHGNR